MPTKVVTPNNQVWELKANYADTSRTTVEGEILIFPYEYWSQNAKDSLLGCFVTASQPIQSDYKYRVTVPDLLLIQGGTLSLGLIGKNAGLYDHNNYLDISDTGDVTGFDGQGNIAVGKVTAGDVINITFDSVGMYFTLPTGEMFMGHYTNSWYVNSMQSNVQFRISKAAGIPPPLNVQKTPNI